MSAHDELAPVKPWRPATLYAPNYRPQSVGDLEVSQVDTFSQLRNSWDIMVKQWSLILAVAGVLTLAVAIYSFKIKPVYRATARIDVESEQPLINKLDDLWGRCDYITIHTPLSAETLVTDLPKPYPVPLDTDPPIPLWNTYPVLGLFLALITLEWVLRKRRQMV